MTTPRWGLFVTVVGLATLALLSLSRASAAMLRGGGPPDPDPTTAEEAADAETVPRSHSPVPTGGTLFLNVAITHGLLGVTVLAVAWYAAIPPSALGLGAASPEAAGVGVAVGVGLDVASEAVTWFADRLGVTYDELLRELLAPEGLGEWALLLVAILPVVAAAEELLFRAALIGAVGAGYDVPVAVLVVGSSLAFGAGHSAQGGIGVAVTAALGLVLGTAFVLTGSLFAVVVAHYVVNALEFVVREGIVD